MAKQRFGINDAYRGTVGTVIGYEWRGRWCLRARPTQVHNPRTPKQQNNRQLFKQMVAMASNMKPAIRKGLHVASMQQGMTEGNLFVRLNKDCFALDSEGGLAVEWGSLRLSSGTLATPLFTSVTEGEALQIDFEPCAEGERASRDDVVYVYAYCPEAGEGMLSNPVARRERRVDLRLPWAWQGATVHLYGFAVDLDGRASDSVYIVITMQRKKENGPQRSREPQNNTNDKDCLLLHSSQTLCEHREDLVEVGDDESRMSISRHRAGCLSTDPALCKAAWSSEWREGRESQIEGWRVSWRGRCLRL